MFCPKCGKPIPDDSSFCMFCGKSIPRIFPEKPPAEEPVQAPPAPFGDADFEVPFMEEEYDEPPVEPETFVPLPDDLDLLEPAPTLRRCRMCGRELPETNVTGICVTCTNNRSFVPAGGDEFRLDLDLDDEYPEEYREASKSKKQKGAKKEKRERPKRRIPLLPILAAALLMGAAACFAAFYLNNGEGGETASQGSAAVSAQEKKAAGYAQEMVKEKAANPSSVHFDARSLKVTEKQGVWTVKQTFERLAPDGQMAQSNYTAMLKVGDGEGTYEPLMLQVDETTLYDNR